MSDLVACWTHPRVRLRAHATVLIPGSVLHLLRSFILAFHTAELALDFCLDAQEQLMQASSMPGDLSCQGEALVAS